MVRKRLGQRVTKAGLGERCQIELYLLLLSCSCVTLSLNRHFILNYVYFMENLATLRLHLNFITNSNLTTFQMGCYDVKVKLTNSYPKPFTCAKTTHTPSLTVMCGGSGQSFPASLAASAPDIRPLSRVEEGNKRID